MKNVLTKSSSASRAHRSRPLPDHHGEGGSALIAALLLMSVLFVISIAAAQMRTATATGLDERRTQQDEYWTARSGAAAVEASVTSDIPTRYDQDIQAARNYAGAVRLPSFDDPLITAAASRPILNLNGSRSSYPVASCTSLLGNINTWAFARRQIAIDYASQQGFDGSLVGLPVMEEAYRQTIAGENESAYVMRYVIDAVAGSNGRVRPSGLIVLSPANFGCSTSVQMSANPGTITIGQSVTLTITYQSANNISVTDSLGNTVYNQNVTESSTPATVTVNVTPPQVGTITYTASVTSSGACSATTGAVSVQVNNPPCPVINVFAAAPNPIYAGQTTTITWNVSGASVVTLNGNPVAAVGNFVVSPAATTTYTLAANNSNASCPVQRQITVTVIPCPSITSFSVNPKSVIGSGNVTVSWSVADASAGTVVSLDGVVVAASGSQTVNVSANRTFTLSVAGPGTCPPDTRSATVTVDACPVINSFSATPNSVNPGSGSTLDWNIGNYAAGTVVRLNGNIVAGPVGSTFVSPASTTTYTLSVTGPGACTTTQQVTVSVGPCPSISQFSLAPSSITAGQNSTLTWNVGNVSPGVTVTINGAPVSASGSTTVSPATTSDYTITVTGPGTCPLIQQTVRLTVAPLICPVINNFSLNPVAITSGQTSVLTWDVGGAGGGVTVSIDGVPVAASGSRVVSPASTTSYRLDVSGPAGCPALSRTITLTVNACPTPMINLFTASPNPILTGESTILTWSVSNLEPGATITIIGPGLNTAVGAAGSMPVVPSMVEGDFLYRIVAQNPCGGGTSSELTVDVRVDKPPCPLPTIQSFTANPSSVTQGGNQLVRLSWNITDTSGAGISLTISPGVGTFNVASGFVEITQPAVTTVYTLTVTNGCGKSAAASATVAVSLCPTPSVANFTASPSNYTQGKVASVRLAWQVNDSSGLGVTVSISGLGGGLPSTGFMDIAAPATTTTFTLTATNGCGVQATAQVTVTVGTIGPRLTVTANHSGTWCGWDWAASGGSEPGVYNYQCIASAGPSQLEYAMVGSDTIRIYSFTETTFIQDPENGGYYDTAFISSTVGGADVHLNPNPNGKRFIVSIYDSAKNLLMQTEVDLSYGGTDYIDIPYAGGQLSGEYRTNVAPPEPTEPNKSNGRVMDFSGFFNP